MTRLAVALLALALLAAPLAVEAQPGRFPGSAGQHLAFSLRHRGENVPPRVTQRDVRAASVESWWGRPIVVRPDQLFARSLKEGRAAPRAGV